MSLLVIGLFLDLPGNIASVEIHIRTTRTGRKGKMRKLRIIFLAGLAGCAPEQPIVLSVVGTNLTEAQQRAEVARWLPGCRAVSARQVPGRIPRVEIRAMCRRVPAGEG